MSQNGDRNLEAGEDAGIVSAAWPLHLGNSPTCIADHSHVQHASVQNQQSQLSQGESNFRDGSRPLFSIYSKAADEEDKKMVERWKQDADGIILFVSYRVRILTFMHNLEHYRLVYSLLQSLRSFPYQSRT